MKLPRHPFLVLAAAMPLAGCISFGAKPPPTLMALSPTTPLAAGPAISTTDKKAVAIGDISVVPALASQRVLVTDGPTAVAYLKGGLWTAQPNLLFRSLLSETITTKTGRVVPDRRLLAIQPDTRLSGQISAFGLDGPGMAVVVTFDATIAHEGSDTIQARRFTARLPVSSDQPQSVASALNQAANQVAGEVADWIGP
jgi:cholesterol transport system auxiliary component